jgi:hypothetical protein
VQQGLHDIASRLGLGRHLADAFSRRLVASPAKAVMAAVITTTIQARSNPARPLSVRPPSTATKVATPRAEPSWRAVASTADADASCARGAASAQANSEG